MEPLKRGNKSGVIQKNRNKSSFVFQTLEYLTFTEFCILILFYLLCIRNAFTNQIGFYFFVTVAFSPAAVNTISIITTTRDYSVTK